MKLNTGNLFIGFVETKKNRKKILNKLPFPFNWMHYTVDFILHRAFPKLAFTKKIYFYITKGNNRALTKAETLGRLVSCGFEIKDYMLDTLTEVENLDIDFPCIIKPAIMYSFYNHFKKKVFVCNNRYGLIIKKESGLG